MAETKKILETLTPAQERLADKIADRYIAELTKPPKYNHEDVLAWLDLAYKIYELKQPERVEVVDSPYAALRLATELTGEKQTYLDWCGVGEGGWVAFYEVFEKLGVLTKEENADVMKLRDFARSAWDSVLLDECAIVVRRPKSIVLDDEGNLHSMKGPVIEWRDGEKDYAYHGTWVTERIVMSPKSHTKAEYLAITNTEERRALGEIAGWDWVVSLLGGSSVDEWKDPSTKLKYRLFACDGGLKLLSKQSPKLKNGSQPTYMEPVHEDLATAQAARKWQALPRLTAAECNKNPVLSYGSET